MVRVNFPRRFAVSEFQVAPRTDQHRSFAVERRANPPHFSSVLYRKALMTVETAKARSSNGVNPIRRGAS